MSQPVSYNKFCLHYDLDRKLEDSKIQYDSYCRNLNVVHHCMSEMITQEAIEKAKNTK